MSFDSAISSLNQSLHSELDSNGENFSSPFDSIKFSMALLQTY